jgi:xanthine dehydrogenase YagS FAD-binding subunit
MRNFEHVAAASVPEALELLAVAADADRASAARVIAGGTDLVPLLKAGLDAPARLIDLKPARALRFVRFEPDGELRIGALATLADLERDVEVRERLPILHQAVHDAATPQLRTMATVGGNLLQRTRCWYFRGETQCWLKGGTECFARDGENKYHAIFEQSPCVAVHPSDVAPALVALDAQVVIEGPQGARTVTVDALLQPPAIDDRREHRLGPREVISEVRVPAQPDRAGGAYIKTMDRRAWAFALVSAAVQVALRDGRVEQVRLVLGGVANVPWRVRDVETLLQGQELTPELALRAAEAALRASLPLSHNGYKVPMAREVARRALLLAGGVEQ